MPLGEQTGTSTGRPPARPPASRPPAASNPSFQWNAPTPTPAPRPTPTPAPTGGGLGRLEALTNVSPGIAPPPPTGPVYPTPTGAAPPPFQWGSAPAPFSWGAPGHIPGTVPTGPDPMIAWLQGQQGINDAARAAAEATFNTQRGVASGTYQSNLDALRAGSSYDSRYLGIDNERLAANRGFLGAANQGARRDDQLSGQRWADQRAFIARQYGLSKREADLAFGNEKRRLTADATARGAFYSTGRELDAKDARNQYGLNVNSAKLSRDEGNSANNLARERDKSSAAVRAADLKRQDAMLSALGKEYGVRAEQIDDALWRGSARLGMDYAAIMSQIADAQNANNAQSMAQAEALIHQLLNLGG